MAQSTSDSLPPPASQIETAMALDGAKAQLVTLACSPRRWQACLYTRKTQINAFEILAALAAWRTWGRDLEGTRVLCFVDNTVALDVIVSGSSKRDDLNWISGQCWLAAARARCVVAWSWVASKNNPADAPSRADLQLLRGVRRRALVWPAPPEDWRL